MASFFIGKNLKLISPLHKTKDDWEQKFGTFWADKIFVSDFDDYQKINEEKAMQFINTLLIR